MKCQQTFDCQPHRQRSGRIDATSSMTRIQRSVTNSALVYFQREIVWIHHEIRFHGKVYRLIVLVPLNDKVRSLCWVRLDVTWQDDTVTCIDHFILSEWFNYCWHWTKRNRQMALLIQRNVITMT